MRKVFCKYMVAEKGIKLYSGLLTGHKAKLYASGDFPNLSNSSFFIKYHMKTTCISLTCGLPVPSGVLAQTMSFLGA